MCFVSCLLIVLFNVFFIVVGTGRLSVGAVLQGFFDILHQFGATSILGILKLDVTFITFVLVVVRIGCSCAFSHDRPGTSTVFQISVIRKDGKSRTVVYHPFTQTFAKSSPLVRRKYLLDT